MILGAGTDGAGQSLQSGDVQTLRSESSVWGDRFTSDGRAVVAVAGVVRWYAKRYGRAVKPAARHVLDRLDAAGDGLQLFRFVEGDCPEVATEATVWRKRYPSGPESRAARQAEECRSALVRVLAFSMTDGEKFARGLSGDHCASGEDDALAELPQLSGKAGALAWARHCWADMAASLDDLDSTAHGQPAALAILEADVRALFPELEWPEAATPSAHAEPATRHAAQAAALEAAAPPADFARGKPWTDPHRLAFLAAYEALMAAGVGKDAALSELAAKGWANTGPTLQKRITEGSEARAREQRKGGRLHAA